jgi:hypothetical protein
MKVGIMQPYFFPYFGYFQLIGAVDIYVNLDHVSFMKRSYMTRNRIKDETPINIPVYEGSQNKKCSEIFVNFESQYLAKFKKKIYYLYGKSTLYEEINRRVIDPCFLEEKITISEFNLRIIKKICEYLEIETKIIETSEGLTNKKKGEGLKEISKREGCSVYINAIGGIGLYSKEDFKLNGIDLYFIEMGDVKFDNPYSSILDLLYTHDREHLKKELKNYKLT